MSLEIIDLIVFFFFFKGSQLFALQNPKELSEGQILGYSGRTS